MAAELNIEAERREFEAEVLKLNPDISLERWPAGHYKHHAVDGHWKGWQLARRAAPSSSADELPPLPWGDDFEAWLEPRRQKDVAAAFHDYARDAIQAAAPADANSVPIPTHANMARLMLALGYNWLKENAPEHLRAPAEDAQTEQPSAFVQHLQQSAKLVDGWPEWKRGLWAEDAREQQPEDAADLRDVIEFALILSEKEDAYSVLGFLQAWNWESDSYLRVNWPEFAEFELSRRATGTDRAQAGEGGL